MIQCCTIKNPNPGTEPSPFPPWMMRLCWLTSASDCPNCTLYQWKAADSADPLLRCSECKAVRYCSKKCQREHWAKQHKAQCRYMRVITPPTQIVEAYEKGDWAYVTGYYQRMARENPVQTKFIKKSNLLTHIPSNCSTCQQVAKLGPSINSISDPHWGCLLGPFSSYIELRDDEFSEEYEQAKLPFALGEMTGKYTSRYEQTLSLMNRVLHKMYVTSHRLMEDDARMRSMFQLIVALRMELTSVAVTVPPGQILEYFHQDQLSTEDELSNSKMMDLQELVSKMSKDSSSEEEMTNDSPYKLWKTFQILLFYCLHPTHADRVLFDELGEEVPDVSLADALSNDETSEKFIRKRQAILDGLEKGLMPYSDLLDILCENNRQKTCRACNEDIVIENTVFPYWQQPPSRPSLLVMFGLGPAYCCSNSSSFKTVWEKIQTLSMKLMTMYHHFALKYTPNRCDMCLKFSKKVHRCNHCFTKVYCSEQCRDQDWKLIHKEICGKEQDDRKVKGGAKGRKKEGEHFMQDYTTTLGQSNTWFQSDERLKDVVKDTAKKLNMPF